MSEIGHNSNIAAAGAIKDLIRRIEEREKEKADIAEDIRHIFAEAHSAGFNTKIMRKVLRLRKQSDGDRAQEEAMIAVYCNALGMQMSLPLELPNAASTGSIASLTEVTEE